MEDWKELQIFNALFIELPEEGKTNDIYDHIENCEIVKPPYYNDSHQYGFSAIPWYNKGDKFQFALNKRQWFMECQKLNSSVRDVIIIDGYKYFLIEDTIENPDSQVLRVYKDCTNVYNDGCWNQSNPWCCGDWVDVSAATEYKDPQGNVTLIWWRPTKDCLQKKFTRFYWPRKAKTRFTWRVRNELVWDKILSYAVIDDSFPSWVVAWQYLYVTKCIPSPTYDTNACWFVWQVWVVAWAQQTSPLWEANVIPLSSSWIWLWWVNTQKQWNPFTQQFDNINYNQDNYRETWLVEFLVFEEWWEVFWFVTSDWVVVRHWDECGDKIIYEYLWATYKNSNFNSSSPSLYHTWLAQWNNWLVTITNWSKVTFFQNGTNFWYSWWEFSFTADWKFDQILPVRDYLLLFGPKDIWFIYRRQTDSNSITWYNYWFTHAIEDEVWYLTKSSFINFRGKAYLIASNHKMYGINIKPSFTSQTWYADFEFRFDQQIHSYVNTDIESIYPTDWDEVYLTKNENQMRVFITNRNKTWTKILFFEDQYKVWHKRYTCNLQLYWEKDGCRYWQWGTYLNAWDNDMWAEIKQKIWFHFWDYWASAFTPKQIELLKFMIWYNSQVTANTTLKVTSNLWWWLLADKDSTLHTTEYIKNITRARTTRLDNPVRLTSYPIWFWLMTGNQIWFPEWKIYNTSDDIDAYCFYENNRWKEELDCANEDKDLRILWEPSEVNIEYKEPYFENTNYNQRNEQYNWIPVAYWISKFWTIAYPFTKIWEVFMFERIADWTDRLEFVWAQVLFHFKEAYDARHENIMTDLNLEQDSWITQPKLY